MKTAGFGRRILLIATSVATLSAGIVGMTLSASAGDSPLSRNCTPGYKPCIPNKPSDVDCYGGGGNGPRYTKPGVVYKVWGSDRYRLDADNDGKGCE